MTSLNMENETDLIKKKGKFIESLDNYNTDVYINGKGFTVHFKENNRIYTIDENSKIKQEDMFLVGENSDIPLFDILTNQIYPRI